MDRRLKEVGSQSYISTDIFNNNFYSYVITTGPSPNFIKTAALVPVSTGTSVNCPAGHILRENGKKLYPPEFPGAAGAYPGVTTYMVGVYDTVSGLKGYINPNDPMFAPFNGERPNYQPDSLYTTDGVTKNLGSSVLTLGHITSSGDVTSPGQVVASGQLRSSTITSLTPDTSGNLVLDISQGQVFRLTVAGTVNMTTINEAVGAVVYLKVLGSGAGSLVFGANILGLGPLTTVNTKIYMLMFVSDGTNLCEVSRTAAYTDTA